jgi:hypothetical protein
MKKFVMFTLVLFSQAAMASDYNEVCLNRYRDASYSLIDQARALNHGRISNLQFLAEFSLIETQIGAKRLICAMEDESIKDCVRAYKKQYQKVRANINMQAIAEGEQTSVSVGLVEAALTVTDIRCQ